MAAWLVLASVAGSAPLGAQSVQGHLRRDADGTPLGGARVVLLDAAGTPSSATLSGADGEFALRAPTAGAYRLKVEYPGFDFDDTPVQAGDAPASLELPGRPVVLSLPDGERKPGRDCALEAEDAARIASVWAEVRKTFRAAVLVKELGLVRFETETWYRHLDPRHLRVVEESTTPRAGFHATGRLPSPSPEDLASEGYVRGGGPGESLAFYAPDATTLVSTTFTASHCLGFDDDGPEDGWVGLTFRPRDDDARDVEGTLWIDGDSYEPMRVEYHYTTLPWPVKADKTGGMLDFARTESGAPVVQRWWMRMPRVEMKNVRITQWAEPQPRYTLSALVEEGGRVLRVQTPDGQIENMR